jgi:hypothetical protein
MNLACHSCHKRDVHHYSDLIPNNHCWRNTKQVQDPVKMPSDEIYEFDKVLIAKS